MRPKKPVQPTQSTPKRRFEMRKLEERIAPKGPPFTKKCRPSW